MSKPNPSENPTPQSRTSSTAPRKAAKKSAKAKEAKEAEQPDFDPVQAVALLGQVKELLERKDKALEPIERFHEAVEGATDEDVRIYFDVRIVYGRDKPLKQIQGSSSMPGLLSEKLLPNAPSMIQQEVVEKVALPLTGIFMKEGEIRNPVTPRIEDHGHPDAGIDPERTAGGDQVMNLADEHDADGVVEAEVLDEDDEDEDIKARVPAESAERREDGVDE